MLLVYIIRYFDINIFLAQSVEDLSNVKNSICHLYNALNIEQHQLAQELDLKKKLEELQKEIAPLERVNKLNYTPKEI